MPENRAVDPGGKSGEIGRALLDTDTEKENPEKRPARCRRRWPWVLGLIILCGLVWLSGPGVRWIAPKVAGYYLEKAGMRGDFRLEGNLVGGLSVSDLRIESDGLLAGVTIDRVIPKYHWKRVVKGELDGLTVEGVHVDLRLGAEKDKEEAAEEKAPLDLGQLGDTIRMVRARVVPVELDLRDITLAATQDGKAAFALASSRISHKAGSPGIDVQLGEITDPTGKVWPGQQSAVVWNEEDLSIERIDPYPGVGVRDFVLQYPMGAPPSLETMVQVEDAVLVVSSGPGFTTARVDLREGRLKVEELAKRFGQVIPAEAELTSLAVEVNQLLPDPMRATGSVRVLVEGVRWEDWQAPEVSLDVTLADAAVNVAARVAALGTELVVDAGAPLERDGAALRIGVVEGDLSVPDVPKLVAELAKKFPAIDAGARVPASALGGEFRVGFTDNVPSGAEATLRLTPVDKKVASEVVVKGAWETDQPVTAELAVDGMVAGGSYDLERRVYQGTVRLEDFTNTRLDAWLAVGKVRVASVATIRGEWAGGGDLNAARHQGKLVIADGRWSQAEAGDVLAAGTIRYDWPGMVEASGLDVKMENQRVVVDAALRDGVVRIAKAVWSEGADELAEASGRFPVPGDFSKWREMLVEDRRPLELEVHSRVLSLAKLKPWVPAMEQLDPRSTGQLQVSVKGTYSVPEVDAVLEARDLRSPAQPDLPPGDLKVTVKTVEGKLQVAATATAPNYPAAEMKASLPFRPSKWAEDPESLKGEPISARVDLPRLELSRFTTLVPAAEQLSGNVTGNVVASGTLGKPVMKGEIVLSGGGARLKDARIPSVQNMNAAIDVDLDKIVLRTLRTTIAGGTVEGGGSLALVGGKPGNLEMRLKGDHLPLVRNEMLILRANFDLRLQGTWEKATVSGTLGAVDSVFFRDIEILPIGRPFNAPSAAAVPKVDPPKTNDPTMPLPFRDWGLNVTVRTEEPFIIRGNLATGEVTGSIRLGGTLGNPLPNGAAKLSNFRATLPFSTLNVRSGTATFTPANGFDPVLEMRGTAEPRPYRVTAYVYGRMSDPQLVLTSTPPLPDNEIMTLLATGTTTTGLEDPQAASSRTLQLFAEELRRGRFGFGKQLRPLLAVLDRVDFSLAETDPYSNDSFSTATLAITDRWFLSAGMGREGDSRVMGIWRLTFR